MRPRDESPDQQVDHIRAQGLPLRAGALRPVLRRPRRPQFHQHRIVPSARTCSSAAEENRNRHSVPSVESRRGTKEKGRERVYLLCTHHRFPELDGRN